MPNYVRVHNKKGTDEFWSSLNPVLLDGEIIIVSVGESSRLKVGDGVTHYTSLPFLGVDDDVIKEIEEIKNNIDKSIAELKDSVSKKLDDTVSPKDVGKILSVDSLGRIVLTNLDISGQNVTVSSVIGLTEMLESKANNSVVEELAEEIKDLQENGVNTTAIEEISKKLDSKAENSKVVELANTIEELEKEIENLDHNSVEGLAEILNSKADDSFVKELARQLGDKAENEVVLELANSLEGKADNSAVEELSKQIEDLQEGIITDVKLEDVSGLQEVLDEKASNTDVEELTDKVDAISDRMTSAELEIKKKLSSVMSPEDSGKVLCIDDEGNVVPKEIQFSEGGGGTGSSGGILTWGDLIKNQ